MPRTLIPDPCFICGDLNCRCGRPELKARRKATPKLQTPVPVAPTPPPVQATPVSPPAYTMPDGAKDRARAAMKARATRSTPPPASVDDGERVMEDAIRNLARILHPDERHKFRPLLENRSHISARALAWRQRQVNNPTPNHHGSKSPAS